MLTDEQITRLCHDDLNTSALMVVKPLHDLIREVPLVAFMIKSSDLHIIKPVMQFAADEGLNTTKTLRLLGFPKVARTVSFDFCDHAMGRVVRCLDASTFSQTLPKTGIAARCWVDALDRYIGDAMLGPRTGPYADTFRWIAFNIVELSSRVPAPVVIDAIDYLKETQVHRSTSIDAVLQQSEEWHDGRMNIRQELSRRMSANMLETLIGPDMRGSFLNEPLLHSYMMHDIDEARPLTRHRSAGTMTGRFHWGGSSKVFPVQLEALSREVPRNVRIHYPTMDEDLSRFPGMGGFEFVILRTWDEFKKEGHWNGTRLNCVGDGGYFRRACTGSLMIVSCRRGPELIGTAEVSPDLKIKQFREGRHEIPDSKQRRALTMFVETAIGGIPEDRRTATNNDHRAFTEIDYSQIEGRVLMGMDPAAPGEITAVMLQQAEDRLHRSIGSPLVYRQLDTDRIIMDIETRFDGPLRRDAWPIITNLT